MKRAERVASARVMLPQSRARVRRVTARRSTIAAYEVVRTSARRLGGEVEAWYAQRQEYLDR